MIDFAVLVTALEEPAITQADRITVIIFRTKTDKAAVKVQTVSGAERIIFTGAIRVEFTAGEQLKTVKVFAQNYVRHTGDRVRTVNRRHAIKQQICTVNQRTREQVDRWRCRRTFHTGRGKAATVQQNQSTVRAKTAQVQRL